jgi:hypothetical protein
MLIHVTQATFNPLTFCWHLPVRLSYPDRGTIGVIGDVFIHAASGEFVGLPDPHDLLQRAESLAEAHGLIEDEEEEEEWSPGLLRNNSDLVSPPVSGSCSLVSDNG